MPLKTTHLIYTSDENAAPVTAGLVFISDGIGGGTWSSSFGTSGGSGTAGTSGTSGAPGTSGTSGAPGTSGTSGIGFSTITNPGDNRILTSLGTTNTANAESNLTFDGTRLSVTGSAYISGTSSVLTVVGSSSTSTVFSVQGLSGELFNVSDSLVGSLFSVNDISGLPILEVFSDDTTIIGAYQAQSLYTTKRVMVTASATASIYSFATASYTSAHVDYNISSGSNSRAGTLTSVWQGGSITYIENSTLSLGTTSGFTFSFVISGTYAVLQAYASSSTWNVKTIIRAI